MAYLIDLDKSMSLIKASLAIPEEVITEIHELGYIGPEEAAFIAYHTPDRVKILVDAHNQMREEIKELESTVSKLRQQIECYPEHG